jgi:pilus assembly protein CpaF
VDAVGVVEQEVRELVRRRGLDPAGDPVAIRVLVDDVVSEYGDRTLGGSEPGLSDPHQVARQVYDAVAGFGPLQPYLDDGEIEGIWINERLTGR